MLVNDSDSDNNNDNNDDEANTNVDAIIKDTPIGDDSVVTGGMITTLTIVMVVSN